MASNIELRTQLTAVKQSLTAEYRKTTHITQLMSKLVHAVDEILLTLYQRTAIAQTALIAVGSYGRRELILHSDIDIIILHSNEITPEQIIRMQQFVSDCWDIGFSLSHQITTVTECANLAEKDITVISTLLDARLLCGQENLLEELRYQTHQLHMWSSHAYFLAKIKEQKNRHQRYDESAYHLEPNIKSGPGGLRDLHTLVAISKRHYRITKLADCTTCGLLTDKEYETLNQCQQFLWRVRFGLHLIANRAEERLLFDHQLQLAKLLGYQDDDKSLSLEKFMQRYFKVIKTMRQFNAMFVQVFREVVIYKQKQQLTPINEYFRLSDNYIEVTHAKVFLQHPLAFLEIFIIMGTNPKITNIRANTMRLMRQCRYLINHDFRSDPHTKKKFIELIQTSHNIYKQLQFMSRHGILSQYIPEFGRVTGQMQYDLFHIYTVDQHTLFVIRNLIRFKNNEWQAKFPLCHQVIRQIKKPELLILAALFHDIAKGKGGDHCLLGAKESYQFCQQHGLTAEDCLLVSWLVEYHLLMSKTAQQQDIYDPFIITQFCQTIPKAHYLDYLYCLTVADVCATNEKLWNSWKDSLLRELYRASKHHMEQQKLDRSQVIQQRKQKAKQKLATHVSTAAVERLWSTFKGRYFLLENPESIARQTLAILQSQTYPLILIMPHHSKGGTEVFIYMPHRPDRFIITTTLLTNFRTTIQEANITTCDNNFDLDTYIILDEDNKAIEDSEKIHEIQQAFTRCFSDHVTLPTLNRRRRPRELTHFKVPPKLTYHCSQQRKQTQLFLTTADTPGLLAQIARVFVQQGIELLNAKIATAGERVQDTFIINNQRSEPLNQEQQIKLRNAIVKAIQLEI